MPAADKQALGYQEKQQALIVHPFLPAAVRDLATMGGHVGQWETIERVDQRNAIRLTKIADPVLRSFFAEDDHLWVSPTLSRSECRRVWARAFGRKPKPDRHLDHLHAVKVAEKQGYAYVLLYEASPGANMSAGATEKRHAKEANASHAINHPVFFAQETHYAKLWGLKHNLYDEPLVAESAYDVFR